MAPFAAEDEVMSTTEKRSKKTSAGSSASHSWIWLVMAVIVLSAITNAMG